MQKWKWKWTSKRGNKSAVDVGTKSKQVQAEAVATEELELQSELEWLGGEGVGNVGVAIAAHNGAPNVANGQGRSERMQTKNKNTPTKMGTEN